MCSEDLLVLFLCRDVHILEIRLLVALMLCLPSFDFLTMIYSTSKIVQVLFSYHKCAEFAVFAYTFHVEYVHPASRANVPPQRFSSITEIRKQPVHSQSPKSKTPAHMSQHPKLLEHPVREQPNIQRRRNSQVPR